MSGAELLHHRLLAALLLTPIACSSATPESKSASKPDPKPDAKPDAKPEPDPTAMPTSDGTADAKVDPEPVAKTTMDPDLRDEPEPPVPRPLVQNLPTCPNGTWCGIVSPPSSGPGTTDGCPQDYGPTVKPVDPKVPDRPGGPQTSFDPTATKSKRSEGVGDACCYHWVQPCPGGRPLRDGDAIVRPRFVAVATGDTLPARGHHPEAAAAWLHDAGSEQASVASFARAAIELLAVGAPAELVLDCHRAAIDEIRHAALCTEIAWSLGAPHQAPRVIPAVAPREASILLVAVDSFVEGCVGETLAALVASKAALACTDAGIRSALESIADDEERHAALAWRTVAWALEAGGSAVAEALREAAAHRRPQREPPFVAPDRNDELAHLGRLGIAAQDEALRHGWRDVIDPLLQALLERAAADGVLNPQAAAAAC